MDELIPITLNENQEQIISGRLLHEFLTVATRYNDWFDRKVEYGFNEGEDYEALTQKRVTAQGNETTYIDHAMKLDMAKEICMLEKNEKGKLARQYFIQAEKDWNSPDKILARAIKIAEGRINQLQLENKIKDQQIAELKPKADYTDRILNSKGTIIITAIAKDYGMSGTAFNKLLHDLKVQYKRGGVWLLYEEHQAKGYTHSKPFDYKDSQGLPQVRMNTEWTQKGRLYLYELLKANGFLPMIERPSC